MKNKREHIFSINIPEYYGAGASVRFDLDAESSLDTVIEAFENFLKGIGYVFPEGLHLGYEEDDEVIPADETVPVKQETSDWLNSNLYDKAATPEDELDNKQDKNNLL